MARWLASRSVDGPVPVISLRRSLLRIAPRLSMLSLVWSQITALTELTLSKPEMSPIRLPRHSFFTLPLSWEYPGLPGIGCNEVSTADSENFLAFLQELRSQPAAKNLYITAAVADSPFAGPDGQPMTNVSQFADVLDHIAIMNYDINVCISHVSHQKHA